MSEKVNTENWGKSVVKELSEYVQNKFQNIRGFSPQNIWRMKQFFEIYLEVPKLSPLVREISWTNNLIILSKCKIIEEREFYILLATREKLSKRELERQINSGVFERTMLANKKLSTQQIEFNPDIKNVFKDTYVFEFLDLPKEHNENEMNFYLEALDRDVKLQNENPSVGILLCKNKDSEVVEYALSRNLSPALIADYETKLIDKELLKAKLREFYEILEQNIDD